MCGICGVWAREAGGLEPAVRAMVAAMPHRGPDEEGVFSGKAACLGQRRLKVIDLSPLASQPMFSPDEMICLVYNGEVYNFAELRRELEAKGHSFKSRSDTEVVLRLYEHLGDDFLLRLRGIFALALYDRREGPGREKLLLARDHLGVKPLLYSRSGGRLVFASEIKAILASGLVPPRLDPEALRTLLTFGSVQQPRTILQDVSMLPPAHRLVARGETVKIERYWAPALDRVSGLRRASYEEQVEAVAQELGRAVSMQMVSDVPIGAFLSGGIDSSLTVALMARAAGNRVKTFSVGFKDSVDINDESAEAQRTARFLGADHHEVLISGEDVAAALPAIAAGLDQPTVDGVNSYLVSAAARQGVTVAISGTGGDELFAGYPWFAQMARYQASGRTPSLAARLAQSPWCDRFLTGRWGRRIQALRREAGFLAEFAGAYHAFGSRDAALLMHPDLRATAHAGRAMALDLAVTDDLPRAEATDRVTALCLRGYTNNQLLRDIDAASMAHSLEVRVPFLDVPLLDLALSLPAQCKLARPEAGGNPHQASYRELGGKRVLMDAGLKHGLLPPDMDLQPKRGFNMPNQEWLMGPMRPILHDTLADARIRQRGWLEPRQVAQVRDGFLAGTVAWNRPWLLMMLELWAQQVLDKA